jgi:hypothetical protein
MGNDRQAAETNRSPVVSEKFCVFPVWVAQEGYLMNNTITRGFFIPEAGIKRKLAWVLSEFIKAGLMLVLLICAMAYGDQLLAWNPSGPLQPFWPLVDSFVHCGVALVILAPLFLRSSKKRALMLMLLAGGLAVFIDLDHVIVARSFSIYEITHHGRPFPHTLWLACGAGVLTLLLRRRWDEGWVVFAALASHVIRDASSGNTPFLIWPSPVASISMFGYYFVEITLLIFSISLALRSGKLASAPNPVGQSDPAYSFTL